VVLTWKHNDSATSEYKINEGNTLRYTVKNQTSFNITGLSPATSYKFSITLGTVNETSGKPTYKNITTGKGQGKQGWWLQQWPGEVRREVWRSQDRTLWKRSYQTLCMNNIILSP